MRTFLSKTALGAVIIATFFACTKDLKEQQVTTQDGILTAAKVNSVQAQALKVEKKPILTPTQSQTPAIVGKEVTVIYTATDATTNTNVECGKITIYKWDGAQWVEVAVANGPSASYKFTPQTVESCAYKFRAGFAPGGGNTGVSCSGDYSGVDFTTQTDFCVAVQQDCVKEFTINDHVDAEDLHDGRFKFTITYTLISPVEVKGIKFQGGATAGGKEGIIMNDLGNTKEVNVNNNNTVIKWEGDLSACTPQQVKFTFTRYFNCSSTPQYVTGDWSAKVGEVVLGSKQATYSCN